MSSTYYIILIQLIINFLIIINFEKISKFINVYDIPGGRKRHDAPVATLGGSIFFLNYLVIYFIGNYLKSEFLIVDHIFIFFSSLIFIVGFVDDKKNLKANKKFFLFTIIILIHLFFENKYLIEIIDIDFLSYSVNLNITQSYIFTILCILLFMNASNLYDGINLQFGIYMIVILSYLIFKNPDLLFFKLLVLPLIFVLYLNNKNKCFFGDSGTLFISYVLAFLIIDQNKNYINLSISEILLLMIVPGIDMLRLFVKRLISKRSPFDGDTDHLHHLLINKTSLLNSNLILFGLLFFPLLIFIFLYEFYIFLLLGVMLIYTLIYFIYKK